VSCLQLIVAQIINLDCFAFKYSLNDKGKDDRKDHRHRSHLSVFFFFVFQESFVFFFLQLPHLFTLTSRQQRRIQISSLFFQRSYIDFVISRSHNLCSVAKPTFTVGSIDGGVK
jgi:hypothetical protein